MKPRALIFSHWTSETDLAALLRDWPEFASGEGYTVDLHCATSGDGVEIRLVHEEDDRWLLVASTNTGGLFERALGRVALEMARTSAIQLHTVDNA
jgi:hypothetical protein